jgi:transposase
MDNLPLHKVAGICETVEAAGAMPLCLPPYSPDLNLIEMTLRKFEARLRKAAKRTIPGLVNSRSCEFQSPEFQSPELRSPAQESSHRTQRRNVLRRAGYVQTSPESAS